MERHQRAAQIEEAAYKVLAERGFKGASMLAIAKAAKASNETLYKWYGDKTGLFAAMIESNALLVTDALQKVRGSGKTGLPALQEIGETLLRMVTSDKAAALNKAAAGDMTGKLGHLLAQEGRARVFPILAELMQEAYGPETNVDDRTECFIALLIGDLQVRRVISAIEQPGDAEIRERAQRAIGQLQRIYPLPSDTR